MARTLKNNSLTNSLVGVLAVDDDGSTVGVWTTPGSSTKLTDGSGLTLTGISTLSSQTFGSSSASAIVADATGDRIVLSSPISVTATSDAYLSFYAAVVDFDAAPGSTVGLAAHLGTHATTINYGMGPNNSPGTAKQVFIYNGNVGNASLTTLAGDTKFGMGAWIRCATSGGTGVVAHYYGAAGSTMSDDTGAALNVNPFSTGVSLRAFLNAESTLSRNFNGKVMLVGVWNRQLSGSEFNTLNADPIGALFETTAPESLVLTPRRQFFYNRRIIQH